MYLSWGPNLPRAFALLLCFSLLLPLHASLAGCSSHQGGQAEEELSVADADAPESANEELSDSPLADSESRDVGPDEEERVRDEDSWNSDSKVPKDSVSEQGENSELSDLDASEFEVMDVSSLDIIAPSGDGEYAPLCGDGVMEGPELCDEGEANSDSEPDRCRTDCTLPRCGDAVVDSGESCDDGDLDNTDACTTACIAGLNLPKPAQGEVIFSEIMVDPLAMEDPSGEWIEVFNTSDEVFSLSGCVLRDEGTDAWALGLGDQAALLGPKLFGVMMFIGPGASLPPSANAGTAVFAYQNLLLGNVKDSLILECEGVEVDRVEWDTSWPIEEGASLSLDPIALNVSDNDLSEFWCPGVTSFEIGDLGTPMMANPACPPPALDGCRVLFEGELPYVGEELTWSVELFEKGLSDQSAGVDVDASLWLELGVGAPGTLPANQGEWTWLTPLPLPGWQSALGVDRWSASVSMTEPGTYALAARASLNEGETWVYCDAEVELNDVYEPLSELLVELSTDPCELLACVSPPDAYCEPQGVVYVAAASEVGTCEVGEDAEAFCAYEIVSHDCGLLGQICDPSEGCIEAELSSVETGDIVFSELMIRPLAGVAPSAQWVEVNNVSAGPLDLEGCTLVMEGLWAVPIEQHLIIAPGGVRVLGGLNVLAANGGVELDWAWGNAFELPSTAGSLSLRCGEQVIDVVEYESEAGWPLDFGATMSLSPFSAEHLANDVATNWCMSLTLYGAGDLGSPGKINPPCPGDVEPLDACFVANAAVMNLPSGTQMTAAVWVKEGGLTELTPLTDPSPALQVQARLSSTEGASEGLHEVHVDALPATLWNLGFEEGPLYYDGYAAELVVPKPGTWHLYFQVSADAGNTWTQCDRVDDGVFTIQDVSVLDASHSACYPSPCVSDEEPLCVGDSLVSHKGEALCALLGDQAECMWPESELLQDCAEYGATCEEGSCINYPTVPGVGDVVFSELFIIPTDAMEGEEWFELSLSHEADVEVVQLSGCMLQSAEGESWEVSAEGASETLLWAGNPLVFSRSSTNQNLNDSDFLSYEGALSLDNEADTLRLECSGELVDTLIWDLSWSVPVAKTLSLGGNLLSAASNDGLGAWCEGEEKGSPGLLNPLCPPMDGVIDACWLTSPSSLELDPGVLFALQGLLQDAGTTDATSGVDPAPGFVVEAGYGPAGSDPLDEDAGWAWGAAYPDPGWSDEGELGKDRWEGPLAIYTAGEWDVVLRASADGGASWTICDKDGSENGYEPAEAGHITVGAGVCVPNPCTSAPSSTCEGDLVRVYEPEGTCELVANPWEASCAYDSETFDCAPFGGCFEGACVSPPQQATSFGALVISEFMRDSSGISPDQGEWVEIFNPGQEALDLRGCYINDPEEVMQSLVPILIEPGSYSLIAQSSKSGLNGGLSPDAVMPGLSLPNVAGALVLGCALGVVDDVNYTIGWSGSAGVAAQLSFEPGVNEEGALKNDIQDAWCNATHAYGLWSDLGTPGSPNTPCQPGQE